MAENPKPKLKDIVFKPAEALPLPVKLKRLFTFTPEDFLDSPALSTFQNGKKLTNRRNLINKPFSGQKKDLKVPTNIFKVKPADFEETFKITPTAAIALQKTYKSSTNKTTVISNVKAMTKAKLRRSNTCIIAPRFSSRCEKRPKGFNTNTTKITKPKDPVFATPRIPIKIEKGFKRELFYSSKIAKSTKPPTPKVLDDTAPLLDLSAAEKIFSPAGNKTLNKINKENVVPQIVINFDSGLVLDKTKPLFPVKAPIQKNNTPKKIPTNLKIIIERLDSFSTALKDIQSNVSKLQQDVEVTKATILKEADENSNVKQKLQEVDCNVTTSGNTSLEKSIVYYNKLRSTCPVLATPKSDVKFLQTPKTYKGDKKKMLSHKIQKQCLKLVEDSPRC